MKLGGSPFFGTIRLICQNKISLFILLQLPVPLQGVQ